MQYKKSIKLNVPEESSSNGGIEIMPNPPKKKPRSKDTIEHRNASRKADAEEGVRKPRKKKSLFRYYFLNILLGIIILGMLGYILSVAVFVVKRVDVSGNTLYSNAYIESKAMHDGKYRKSTFYQLAMGIIDPVRDIPFVESVKVTIKNPSTIHLKVTEKEMLGVIQGEDGKYVYFDDDGIVKEISKTKLNGVMPVTGLVPNDPKIGKSLSIDKESLTALLNTVKALKKYKMKVDSVKFEDKNRLSCNLGSIYVKFGKYEYLNEKIMRLNIILPKLEGKKGKLHLENWSPNYTDIVFENE